MSPFLISALSVLLPDIIASSLILILLYLPYKLLCANQKQPALNRITIMMIYIIALTAWPVYNHFHTISYTPWVPSFVDLEAPTYEGHELTRQGMINRYTSPSFFFTIYCLGVTILIIRWIFSFIRLAEIKRNCRGEVVNGQLVHVSPDWRIAPFSVLGSIVIPAADMPEAEMIVEHEKVHIRRNHSLDLIFAQIVAIFQWFNPAAWLMMRELKAVHEFEADAGVIDSGIDMKQYQLLLIKKAVGKRFPSPANSLNHSNLKTRITMMKNSDSSGWRRSGALLLVPALILGLAVTNVPAVASILHDAGSEGVNLAESADKGKEISADEQPSRTSAENPDDTADRKLFVETEQLPQFPGGEKAMMQFLADNIRYPESAMKAGKEGRVVVSFVIEKDGSIGETKIQRSVSPALDEEAIRVVKSFPRFSPGMDNGRPVAVWYTLPVSFKLKGDNSPKGNAETAETKSKTTTSVSTSTSVTTDGKTETTTATVTSKGGGTATVTTNGSSASISTDGDGISTFSLPENARIFVNGKEISRAELSRVDASSIASMAIEKNHSDAPRILITLK